MWYLEDAYWSGFRDGNANIPPQSERLIYRDGFRTGRQLRNFWALWGRPACLHPTGEVIRP